MNEIGPVSREAAKKIRERREKWGMSYSELSRRLGELRWDIPPLGLRRIESYQRRIDLDDLWAIAMVLDLKIVDILEPQ